MRRINPVFWILVIVGAILFWMVLSPIFWTIGDFLLGLWTRAKEELQEIDETEEEN